MSDKEHTFYSIGLAILAIIDLILIFVGPDDSWMLGLAIVPVLIILTGLLIWDRIDDVKSD